MARTIRVAAMQLRAHDRSTFMQSLDPILRAVSCAAAECDLLVMPEATFPAYVLGATAIDEPAIAGALERLREIARRTRTVVVVGAAAATGTGIRNAAYAIDLDGSLAGRADKLFLWHFDRRWFAPGERLEPITTSLGVLGVLVCADGRLPTIASGLVDRGAQVLVMPTAWVTSGRNPDDLENVQADLLARVRAYENRVPFIAANKCGAELGMVAYCGKSQVVNARGEILAIAGAHDAETLYATIDLAAPRVAPVVGHPPAERPPAFTGTVRLAISIDPLPDDVDERLELLDDAHALTPHAQRSLDRVAPLPIAWVNDATALDPGGLVEYRRAGYALVAWRTNLGAPWSERIARARALELRVYVVVFDYSAQRAFAVDPDGAIVAGTFGEYRLASFAVDSRKTAETLVAPGSDVGEGLERVARMLDSRTAR
jgi:predicted amidohydrolase